MGENIDNSQKEFEEVERIHHLLSLFLLSKEDGDAKNRLFSETEELVGRLNSLYIEIKINYIAWENVEKPIKKRNNKAEELLKDIDKESTSGLIDLNYCVKVFLDREWERLKVGFYENKKNKNNLKFWLVFLILTFASYIVFGEVASPNV